MELSTEATEINDVTCNYENLVSMATEINDVTCNYENLVSMATEIYLHRFAVDSIQTLYFEQMPPGP